MYPAPTHFCHCNGLGKKDYLEMEEINGINSKEKVKNYIEK